MSLKGEGFCAVFAERTTRSAQIFSPFPGRGLWAECYDQKVRVFVQFLRRGRRDPAQIFSPFPGRGLWAECYDQKVRDFVQLWRRGWRDPAQMFSPFLGRGLWPNCCDQKVRVFVQPCTEMANSVSSLAQRSKSRCWISSIDSDS